MSSRKSSPYHKLYVQRFLYQADDARNESFFTMKIVPKDKTEWSPQGKLSLYKMLLAHCTGRRKLKPSAIERKKRD